MYRHILIATDGSEVAQNGVDHGLQLAHSLGARVTLLTVTEPYPAYIGGEFGALPAEAFLASYDKDQTDIATALLASARKTADTYGVAVETLHVPETPAAEAIVQTAQDRGCDLIVMGSHGRRGIGRLVLGSKTWEVATHSSVPVLVVRHASPKSAG